ncbi:cytidine deaminase [Acetobacter oeni]|uniref:Cytidine deaminase n=1 Tax=Acetobacter oeni TaxID=304077 RepID=A0A511XQ20_9PROT|nr:cytidine deaminase [Acetobacter oeni]MBB3884700.1 cytidine deaminase [Acetobacter oeni]NHO20637.1 cytidine deaminase [Acetobacter oeni]GBR02979.1 cytidine deaminase [Acetobacter oeni LMG 21952]GEN65014.1 cytidine deaminase [Acetobacter oeni]
MTDARELIGAATDIRKRAYAPYSNFRVGAALICDDGRVFPGCNVENAAYPEGICAEGGAISAMVAAGGRCIVEVVVCGGAEPCPPCGGCRQKLREFGAADLKVHMVDPSGKVLITRTLGELLPDSFGPDNLGITGG